MNSLALAHRVEALLQAQIRDDPAGTPLEEFSPLIDEVGWPEVRGELLAILEDESRPEEQWLAVAEVFWGAVLDHRPVPADRLIALLYVRLPPDPHSIENNLAWSIVVRLRGLSYLSEYDPLADPKVLAELATVRPGA
jgi:hypothetical protein